MRTTTLLVVALIPLAHHAALADISQSTISSPGGFAQCGVYVVTSGVMTPGTDMEANHGQGQAFDEHAFSGNSTCQASAAYSGPPSTTGSAAATADLGSFRTLANNSSLTVNPFPGALSNGGWKETFTVSNAALNGQAGYLVFQVRARGALRATGLAGSALLLLSSYKDGVLMSTNPYFNAGNSDSVGTSEQYGRWGIASYFDAEVASRTVDGIVTFSVPITFGQSFTLGVYAHARAGMRSSGGTGEISTARVDFSGDGVTWNGIAGILNSAGQPAGGSTIVSGSGVDWTGPHTSGCAADFDGDGALDFFDYDAFVSCFEGGACPPGQTADFDGDGTVDFFDYDAFVLAFESGC